ncbi:MAG: hypothetical protein IT285_03615 [Bdellovibrionales bacterium]|nr:hypothetical protein [Bdellovibrionales bacterium]
MRNSGATAVVLLVSVVSLVSFSTARAEDASLGDLGGLGSDSRLGVRLLGGVAATTYDLSGTGFNLSLPVTVGINYGGELRYRLNNEGFFVRARFERSTFEFGDLSGLDPDSTEVVVDSVRFVIGGPLLQAIGGSLAEKLLIGLGVEYTGRSATDTEPNQAVSSTGTSSLLVLAAVPGQLSDNFSFEASVALGFSFARNETGQSTGTYKSGLFAEPAFSLGYPVTEIFEVGLSVIARYESVAFSGSGSRGVSGASEASWAFRVPGELRFNF